MADQTHNIRSRLKKKRRNKIKLEFATSLGISYRTPMPLEAQKASPNPHLKLGTNG